MGRALPRPVGMPATFSDWDVYRFGLEVGVRTLPVAPREALKRIVLPVEYIRCAEFRYVLRHLAVERGHRVLDVGSPKLLSLFLAARAGACVRATDLVDYFVGTYGAYASSVLGPAQDHYVMETQDATALTYAGETFDRLFSVSVVEHIPGDGDTRAVREFARVLRPGGIACLTVPWRDDGYVEEFHAPGPGAYWVTSAAPRAFYQRAYDHESLRSRLLGDGRLEIVDVSFWGERRVAVEHTLLDRRLPRLVRYAMAPAHFALNRFFLAPLGETEPSRKKVACITLRRRPGPDGPG